MNASEEVTKQWNLDKQEKWGETPLETIILWLHSAIALMKTKCRPSQKLNNILLTNQISTL